MNGAETAFIKILALMLFFLTCLITYAMCVAASDADDQAEEMRKRNDDSKGIS